MPVKAGNTFRFSSSSQSKKPCQKQFVLHGKAIIMRNSGVEKKGAAMTCSCNEDVLQNPE